MKIALILFALWFIIQGYLLNPYGTGRQAPFHEHYGRFARADTLFQVDVWEIRATVTFPTEVFAFCLLGYLYQPEE